MRETFGFSVRVRIHVLQTDSGFLINPKCVRVKLACASTVTKARCKLAKSTPVENPTLVAAEGIAVITRIGNSNITQMLLESH